MALCVTRGNRGLVAAIETGGDAASLVAKVHELKSRQNTIDRELRYLQPVPRLAPKEIEDRLVRNDEKRKDGTVHVTFENRVLAVARSGSGATD